MKAVHATIFAGPIGLAAVAAAMVATLTATAAASNNPPAMRLRFGDLDLTTQRGIATLYERLITAAEGVCGPAYITGSLIPTPAHVACKEKAIADAVVKIGRPALTQYYLARGGHPTEDTAAVERGVPPRG